MLFNNIYPHILVTHLSEKVSDLKIDLPTEDDLHGAITAVIRLQRTYNLKASDMAEGRIGDQYAGVPLGHKDMLALAITSAKDSNSTQLMEDWIDVLMNSTSNKVFIKKIKLTQAELYTEVRT